MPNLIAYQNEMLPEFNAALGTYVDSIFPDKDGELSQIFHYHLGLERELKKQGKRIRPFLVMLCTEGAGGDWHLALPAAIAIELIHNFSLIHDDIEDNGELRRGKPAVWIKWGLAKGINSGDVMFSAAFRAIEQMKEKLPAEIGFETALLLCDTCLKLTSGQQADIDFQDLDDIQIEQYEAMIEGKTAALISASCRAGALIAGKNEQTQSDYNEFGANLGKAFQMYDDWLGIWGDEEQTGKTASGDLVEGKKSLPVLIGLKKSGRFKERWMKGPIQPSETRQLAQWLREDGVEELVDMECHKLTERALKSLSNLDCNSEVKAVLEEFANKLLIRKH